MKKLRNKTFTRGISFFLAAIMVMSIMVAMTGCSYVSDSLGIGKDSTVEENTTKPTEEANTPAETPTSMPEEITPTITTEPTATPEPTPTPEVMPTLAELIEVNKGIHNLDEDYKMSMSFGYDVEAEEDGMTLNMALEMATSEIAYEGSSYNESYMKMAYMGINEESREISYKLYNPVNSTMIEYYYSTDDSAWYKTNPYGYIDVTGDDDSMLNTDTLNENDFSSIEVTADSTHYYVKAIAVAGSDTDGAGMLGDLGFGDMDAETVYEFTFTKTDKKLVEIKLTCTFNNNFTSEELAEQGIKSMRISNFVLTMAPNTEAISVPADVLASAVLESDISDDTPDADYTDWENEEAIHKGWSSYYNSFCDTAGKFTMTNPDTYGKIPVTLNGAENWYFDNQWSFGTYLAVRDDTINAEGPAYEVLYEDSDVKVNMESFERATIYLLEKDYDENTTSADIVPIVVNGRQAFYLVTRHTEWSRDIVILQDVGFSTYVGIEIETGDVTTEALKLVEKFLLNFVYDGAQ